MLYGDSPESFPPFLLRAFTIVRTSGMGDLDDYAAAFSQGLPVSEEDLAQLENRWWIALRHASFPASSVHAANIQLKPSLTLYAVWGAYGGPMVSVRQTARS